MKIVVIGHKGMLGTDLLAAFSRPGIEVSGFDLDVLNIAKMDSVNKVLTPLGKFDYLINCAAYTDVDACETNRTHAQLSNAEGPKNLAQYCLEHGITLVHFSTDYVFDGTKETPYVETDPCRPLNYYGLSKLAGEQHIQAILPQHYIFRIQWLYGKHGRNFIHTIVDLARTKKRLEIVADQWGTPTWTKEIARCLSLILPSQPPFGIYHLACEGVTNWYEFAQTFLVPLKIPCLLRETTGDKFIRPAKRPSNSRFCLDKFVGLRIVRPHPWEICLKKYLKELTRGG